MGSPYASGTPAGGSSYATGTAATSSPYASSSTTPTPKKSGGGGIGGFFRKAGHVVADKAGRAAHDIKEILPGAAQLAVDETKALTHTVSPHQVLMEWEHPLRKTGGANDAIQSDVVGQAVASKEAVLHPGRDPFLTLLTVGPGVHALGKVGDIGVGLKTGTRLTEKPRLLKSGEAQVPLHGSTNPSVRAAQSIYDAFLQKGLDTKPTGRVAAHAQRRIGGSISETQRYRQHMREVPANEIDAASKKLGSRLAKPGSFSQRKVAQAALRLTSENATAEEAANYHLVQAHKGVAPEANLKQASLYQAVHAADMLHQDEAGNVHVNAEKFPHLAHVDAKIAAGQHQVDQIAVEHGVRTPEALRTRIDAPNRYREGAAYVEPTPARNGVVSPALARQRAYVARLTGSHDRALKRAQAQAHANAGRVNGDLVGLPTEVKVGGETIKVGHNPHLRQLADQFQQMPERTHYVEADPERGARIANWYHNAPDASADPETQRAYQKFIEETKAQHDALTAAGYKFEFYPRDEHGNMTDPYPKGPRQAIQDLTKNKHLYVFPDEAGFGTEKAADTGHALLQDSGVRWNGQPVSNNELFRAVHDVFGHGKEGVGFRASGEEAAYQSHRTMYSPEAQKAMAAETRGQNSWVNFGPHGEKNRTAQQGETVYADQKMVLAPDWVVNEGAAPAKELPAAAVGSKVVSKQGVVGAKGSAIAERLGAALSVEREKLDRMETAAQRRQRPTGIVGGDGARPGRGFVTYATSEPKAGGPVASAQSSVIGRVRPFIRNKAFKAEGLEEGRVPDNTTHLVAQHMRDAYRYVNTDQFRRGVLGTGSDVRRSNRDVLVAKPDEAQGQISESTKVALGKARSTEDQVGEAAGYQAYLHDLIPGLRDNFAEDGSHQIGTAAPDGYRWVDKGALGDLAKPVPGARNVFTKGVDNINAAVTAATVYFKIGHVGTRVLTNAATTIMQGSAAPLELGRSVHLWKALSDTDQRRAMAAAGQKGFEALPAEGTGRTARIAKAGAKWWAKHADAPFRFASIAFEARKAGFDTPEKFRYFLDKLENPHGLDAAQVAKIDWVAKRADRAGIAYDRLNSGEKRFITRGVWFYPWVKGSTLFTGHTIIEHPYKAANLAASSQNAEKRQASILGELPSYEQGLIPLGHGSHPTVTDFSTFSPFATGADVANAVTHPGQLSGFLNPAAGAGLQLITGTNQYGQKTNTPVSSALQSLVSPTPETQILTAFLHRHQDQSKRQFHTTWQSALARALGGPATPRRINKAAANKAAGLEKSGR